VSSKSTDELSALEACDAPEGRSTNGEPPGIEAIPSLLHRGLVEIVSEHSEGWRLYQRFRTTARGREYYSAKAAPIGEW